MPEETWYNVNDKGKTPIEIAYDKGHSNISEYIKRKIIEKKSLDKKDIEIIKKIHTEMNWRTEQEEYKDIIDGTIPDKNLLTKYEQHPFRNY